MLQKDHNIMKSEQKEQFKTHLVSLYKYLKGELKIDKNPTVRIKDDQKNADNILGGTAHYDPDKFDIQLNTTDRHPKDILRSFAHEVVHHWQNINGKLETNNQTGETLDPQYAQNDEHLRKMEKQAYLIGNIFFRDWEDKFKNDKL